MKYSQNWLHELLCLIKENCQNWFTILKNKINNWYYWNIATIRTQLNFIVKQYISVLFRKNLVLIFIFGNKKILGPQWKWRSRFIYTTNFLGLFPLAMQAKKQENVQKKEFISIK